MLLIAVCGTSRDMGQIRERTPMRNTLAGLMMFGLLVAATGAQEPRKDDPAAPVPEQVQRLAWEHAERLCQFVDKGEDNWVEVDKDGKTQFQFRETRRNGDFIELIDKNRGLTLRLYKNAMFLKVGDDFAKYYDGRWVK
jgi:hypothetical protein